MESRKNESTEQRPAGERLVDASLVSIDVPFYTQEIRREKAWIKGPRNAITLFKSDHMRIVLVALHAQADLPKHTAEGTISVQVLEGRIRFSTEQQEVNLNTGQMITLHPDIPHSVFALEEAVFLLTLSPRPEQERTDPRKPL